MLSATDFGQKGYMCNKAAFMYLFMLLLDPKLDLLWILVARKGMISLYMHLAAHELKRSLNSST